MKYESIGTVSSTLLAEFKAYAKLTGSGEDAALGDILTEALLSVAEVTDRAMIDCTITVDSGSDVPYLRLYELPVGQITAVKDADGETYTDYELKGAEVHFGTEGRYTVSYTVTADAASVRRYKYYAFQLATAMHDGNDEEKAKILRQIPASYL